MGFTLTLSASSMLPNYSDVRALKLVKEVVYACKKNKSKVYVERIKTMEVELIGQLMGE